MNKKDNYANQAQYNKDYSPQLFENPILERLSQTRPQTLILGYAPFILFFIIYGFMEQRFVSAVMMFLAGLFFWTLVEYLIHRFVFHYKPRNSKWEKINPVYYGYFIHNIHHTYPRDKLRLVTPLVVTMPLAALFYILFRVIFGINSASLFAGFLLGYVLYDVLHAFTHIYPMRSRVGKFLKYYHMRHHYHHDEKSFGVSSPIWDYVFKTVDRTPLRKAKPNH
jgi:4-hydroxysphinganine ceramide fatty acyl 2-hydroxylase